MHCDPNRCLLIVKTRISGQNPKRAGACLASLLAIRTPRSYPASKLSLRYEVLKGKCSEALRQSSM